MTFRVHFSRWMGGGRLRSEHVHVDADSPAEAIRLAARADRSRDQRAGRSWTGNFSAATAEQATGPGTKQAPR